MKYIAKLIVAVISRVKKATQKKKNTKCVNWNANRQVYNYSPSREPRPADETAYWLNKNTWMSSYVVGHLKIYVSCTVCLLFWHKRKVEIGIEIEWKHTKIKESKKKTKTYINKWGYTNSLQYRWTYACLDINSEQRIHNRIYYFSIFFLVIPPELKCFVCKQQNFIVFFFCFFCLAWVAII